MHYVKLPQGKYVSRKFRNLKNPRTKHKLPVMSLYRDRSIRRAVGRALHDYEMISDGDRVAVGLSGGKDSLALMWVLRERLNRIPIRYSLLGVYVDPGFPKSPSSQLTEFCRQMDYPLQIEYTDCGVRGHSPENKENPCFLCSRLRRKRLFEVADASGSNKLALGHNMDDIIETLFLNMCYGGEISTMVPSQPFFRGRLTVIRPLAYVDKKAIDRFAKDHQFPDIPNSCPTAKSSKRKEIKEMLESLYERNPKIKGNLFRSMSRVKREYLPKGGR